MLAFVDRTDPIDAADPGVVGVKAGIVSTNLQFPAIKPEPVIVNRENNVLTVHGRAIGVERIVKELELWIVGAAMPCLSEPAKNFHQCMGSFEPES